MTRCTVMKCTWCQKDIEQTTEPQRYRYRKTGKIFCTKACGMAHRTKFGKKREVAQPPVVLCFMCGESATLSQGYQKKLYEETGRAYCSIKCSTEFRSGVSSETMARTN